MIKITKEENDMLEKDLEVNQALMTEIEAKLNKIENGEYDADVGEIEAIRVQLDDEYNKLEKVGDKVASFLRNSFVSEKWEDDAGFDYQLTEMKA